LTRAVNSATTAAITPTAGARTVHNDDPSGVAARFAKSTVAPATLSGILPAKDT